MSKLIRCMIIVLVALAALAPGRMPVAARAAVPALSPTIYPPAYQDWLSAQAPHVAGTPTTSAQARQTTAGWTVLVYMAADNDLEGYALADLNEMEFVGSTEGMNVVVEIDRAEGFDSSDGDWTGTRRYFVTRDTSLSAIGSEVVGELGETNTGDPVTLTNFITWGVVNYPAERYALIVWDHGGSWLGVATDLSANRNDLSLPELTQALDNGLSAAGVGPLEVIGFDACLMGSFEVYRAVAPYANYGVGSAELIPGNGWDYLGLLDALASDPTQGGDPVGRAAVDSFMAFYTTVVTQYTVFNLGLVDLGQTAPVAASIQGIYDAVLGAPDTSLEAIVAARMRTPLYGAFRDPQFVDLWAAADMIQFMRLLAESAPGTPLAQAADTVSAAGDGMVLYYRSSQPDAAGGVSIYFPRDPDLYRFSDRYTSETGVDPWRGFLTEYLNNAKGRAGTTIESAIDGVSSSGTQTAISVSQVGGLVTRSSLFITLETGADAPVAVGYTQVDPAGGTVDTWTSEVAYLTDGQAHTPVLVLLDPADPTRAVINGMLVYGQGGETVTAQAVVDLDTNQVIGYWGFWPSAGILMPNEIAVQPGDIFVPLWLTVDENGLSVLGPAPVQFVLGDEPLFIEWEQAPEGSYEVVYVVEDVSGDTVLDDLPAAVVVFDDGSVGFEEVDPDDPDWDEDDIDAEDDNCPVTYNPEQDDEDDDGLGDACDPVDSSDPDGDGVLEDEDNCPGFYNPDQDDEDGDGIGDLCQEFDYEAEFGDFDEFGGEESDEGEEGDVPDSDADGWYDDEDNCPANFNPYQDDADEDGLGDACDPVDDTAPVEPEEADSDGDGVPDDADNCPANFNPDQVDGDFDGLGDVCDGFNEADDDADGVADDEDNCPAVFNPDQADGNGNGIGDACDVPDSDGDGVPDDADNCPSVYNPDQMDQNENGIGDACEMGG